MHGLRSQTLELWLNRHGQNQRTNKFFVDFSNGQIVLLNEEEPYQGNSRKRLDCHNHLQALRGLGDVASRGLF